MTAEEALELTMNNGQYKDAIAYGIKLLEESIEINARNGRRDSGVHFCSYPGPFDEFRQKYGNEATYKSYNIEKELRDYFTKNGFTFEYITNAICGGVRQDPYWIIKW